MTLTIDDPALRPGRLDEFVGQEAIKDSLSLAVRAAKARHETVDHTLFFGPPGLGKTTLAMIIAAETGTNLDITSAPAIANAGDLVNHLTALGPGDVLFIDEIHRLRPTVQEFLYAAMEDRRVDVRLTDDSGVPRVVSMPLAPFTLVGATTRFGQLMPPMVSRFGIVERLDYYPVTDLVAILNRSAHLLGVPLDADAAAEIARRSRGTPRVANRLLRRVRDHAEVHGTGRITLDVALTALNNLRIDKNGLTELDDRVLETIIQKYGGGPVGVRTIAASVGEEVITLEEIVEPYLMKLGFLDRTSRGRRATGAAYQRFNARKPQ